MHKPFFSVDIFADLVGMHGTYQNREYILIELLADSYSAVLKTVNNQEQIQNDFQGEAKRYAPKYFTVPLTSQIQHNVLHPVLFEFFGDELGQQLNKLLQLAHKNN